MSACPGMDESDWRSYYRRTVERPPRATTSLALERFAAEGRGPGRSLDLGCGCGRDTIALLERGWAVLAVDAQPAAIECLRRRPDLPPGARLRTRCAPFETLAGEAWERLDLVISCFALPLCPPPVFARLWTRLEESLAGGGRFAGQLFGERDGWAGDPTLTFHTRAALERLLAGWTVEHLEEEECDSVTPRGRPKHWHLFHLVARRVAASGG